MPLTLTTPEPGTEPGPFTPDMDATHYGIPVTAFGDDGGVLALGHHTPRRALAAFNAYARTWWGASNLADDREARAADWLDEIKTDWVVFRRPDPARGDDPTWLWFMDHAQPDHPQAVPITYVCA
ncbi:hypothetical protein [Streptomyces sp. NPDC094049]|uniref:hypothetical protein n=1 Tax=Streptomyces sp. NPDC094049 TaxID=3154987 RepID=UPI003316545C